MNVASLVTNMHYKVDEASMQRVMGQTTHMARQIGYLIGAATAFEGIKNLLVYTGQMEMLSTQFGVLLGNMQKGKQMMSDIRQMAAVTPFETKELAGAVRLMMTFGVESKKVLGYTSMLGDITMGDQVRFGQVSLAFSQMFAANKLMGQDLLQMVQGGYNPLKTIAEMNNISYDEALKWMAKSQIKPEMVVAAMQKDTGVGGKFYKGMLEGAQTMNGLWSTVSDTTKEVALLIGNIFKGDIKENLAGFVNMLSDNMPAIATFVTTLAIGLEKAGSAFKEIGRFVIHITKQFAPFFLGLVEMVSLTVDFIKTAFFAAVWAISPIIEAFMELCMTMWVLLDDLVLSTTGDLLVLSTVFGAVRGIATILATAIGAVSWALSRLLYVIHPVITFFSFLNNLISTMTGGIVTLSTVITSVLIAGALFALRTQLDLVLLSMGRVIFAAFSGGIAFGAMATAIWAACAPILAIAAALATTYFAYKRISEAMILNGAIGTQQDIDRIMAERALNVERQRGKDLDKRAANGENVSREQKANAIAQRGLTSDIGRLGGDSSLGMGSELVDALGKFKGSGDSELGKIIKRIEDQYTKNKIDMTQNNTVNVNTTVDDKGKSQLSPEALQHSLDKAARSLFNIQLLGVRQSSY